MLLNMVMFKVTICDFRKMNINMTDKIEKRKQPLPCRTMARQQRLCGRRGGAAYRVCSFRRGVHRGTQQHLEYTLSFQCEGIIVIEKKSKKITKVRIKMNNVWYIYCGGCVLLISCTFILFLLKKSRNLISATL